MNETGRRGIFLPLSLFVLVLVTSSGVGIASGLNPTTPHTTEQLHSPGSGTDASAGDSHQDGPLVTDEPDQTLSTQNETIDADYTRMVVSIRSSGDAGWQIVYRQRLESEEEIQAFEELEADIANDSAAYLDPFEDRIQRLVAEAENATGRSMTAENFSIATERRSQPQTEFGVVTYAFDWDGFAVGDGETIRAGDALERLFLEENQDLEFRWPAEYGIQSIEPEASVQEDDHVTWHGRLSFGAGEPTLVLTTEDTGGGDGDQDDGNGATDGGGAGLSQWGLLGIAALVAVLVLGGAYVYRDRNEAGTAAADGPESDGRASDAPAAETPDASAAAGGRTADLMSNEERIRQLLQERDGRMKQKELTEELGWSDARTSQVVGDMRDAGEVETFRIGRENVLTLPDVDIEGSTAPESDDGE